MRHGDAVRAVRLGRCRPDLAFTTAARSAQLTHGHPTGYLAAGAFAALIDRVVSGVELPIAVQQTITQLATFSAGAETMAALTRAVELSEGVASAEKVEQVGAGLYTGIMYWQVLSHLAAGRVPNPHYYQQSIAALAHAWREPDAETELLERLTEIITATRSLSMTGAPPDLAAATARLTAELGGGVTIERVLRATGKSLLVEGDYRGRRAVIKACLTDEPFWQAKFDHEIGIYRAFTTCAPPVRVPELIHAERARVIVIEHIPGHVTDTERYPTSPLDPAVLNTILTTLTGFAAWNPSPKSVAAVLDYPDRVERYHRAGFFDDHDRAALHRLIVACGPADSVAHGDPLPGNLLLSDQGDCVPLDFEFTGLFAAGFDLAMLHTLLAGTPGAQARIEAVIAEVGIETPFLLNQAMVLSREVRLHTELDNSEFRERRLALLRPQWDAFLGRLHER